MKGGLTLSNAIQVTAQKSVLGRVTTSGTVIKIDYTKIPAADLKNLCRTLTEAMIEFYNDPKNLAKFEEWKRNKEANSNGK